ncbi:hypothetical protein KIN20_010909 [Parelaphostrongylus tenuis]|uniref:Uncharacterized protein n=1 Tax=Parelaphostrongylus tenuis TaxID=148309 RepID=A0AAD5MU69_PARTN|nr:hypothetical protein KIN20_010909 [Parelaphostrongylus tenuis]
MSETKLASVISPIAKTIDNISPTIALLLRPSIHATKIRPDPYIDGHSVAQQTPEFTHRYHGYPQAFVRVASVRLAEQAARATRNAHAQQGRASLDLSRSTSFPYFTA